VVIRDKAGNAVRTLQLGEITAGSHNVTWDGKNDAANRVEAGEYTIGITAKDASGKAVTCLQQVSGIVNKVAYENGSAELIINNTRIKLRDVLSIS
jgi:flagellar basal-body rod modification protein FlgD